MTAWRVDGKVKSINKFGGRQFINFFYDGLGNRVAKQVTRGKRGTTTTQYARDAQGNTMGVYQLYVNNVSCLAELEDFIRNMQNLVQPKIQV